MAEMFTVDTHELTELGQHYIAAGKSIRRIMVERVANMGEFARYLCRAELEDVRYTGALANSFVVDTSTSEISARVYPTAKHGIYHRMGTRPHWAPIGPLKAWAAAKLGDENAAYAVQRSIATHGTSVWQMAKRGTMQNPWPKRVVNRPDFQAALRKTAQETATEIIAEIVE